jgi:hypothetical protein
VPCLDLGTDRGTCESFVSISPLARKIHEELAGADQAVEIV